MSPPKANPEPVRPPVVDDRVALDKAVSYPLEGVVERTAYEGLYVWVRITHPETSPMYGHVLPFSAHHVTRILPRETPPAEAS